VVDDVTIEGAGNWHTVIKGRSVALPTPAPDGSAHTGVGFDGRPAAEGGSRNVHLRGFATDNIVVDQIADALNFHTGVTGSLVRDNFIRDTGDDGLAMRSEHQQNAGNRFERNTVQSPVPANGIALYGGADNAVVGNLVADPVREGSGIRTTRSCSSASGR
jgi:hypothetical protein